MGQSGTNLDSADILEFLNRLGERLQQPHRLYLLGGGALCLLGNTRRTLDIDYVGSDLPGQDDVLSTAIRSLANEMHIEVEGVPIHQLIPLPQDFEKRHLRSGQYGNIIVYIFDPYSIAISKLDRGFETDLQDVLFLIRRSFIDLSQLEHYANIALQESGTFDMNPKDFKQHLTALRYLLSN